MKQESPVPAPKKYKWLGMHIIMGIPTRTLTEEEYAVYGKQIEACETAMHLKIYQVVTEE
jgi:hypothetical protein